MNVLDPNNLTKARTEIMQTCSISDVVMTFDGVPVVESSSMHLLGPKPMFSQVVIFIDFYLSSPRLEVYICKQPKGHRPTPHTTGAISL